MERKLCKSAVASPLSSAIVVIKMSWSTCEITISNHNNFSIFNILKKFKHSITSKKWKFFIVTKDKILSQRLQHMLDVTASAAKHSLTRLKPTSLKTSLHMSIVIWPYTCIIYLPYTVHSLFLSAVWWNVEFE